MQNYITVSAQSRTQATNNGCYPSQNTQRYSPDRREQQLSQLLGNFMLEPERPQQAEPSSVMQFVNTIGAWLDRCGVVARFAQVNDQRHCLCFVFQTDYEYLTDRVVMAMQFLRENLAATLHQRVETGTGLDRGMVMVYVWVDR